MREMERSHVAVWSYGIKGSEIFFIRTLVVLNLSMSMRNYLNYKGDIAESNLYLISLTNNT